MTPRPAQRSGNARVMIVRALRRRCPVCGKGSMFTGWLKMRDYCSNCGFRFDRNESDYFIGAYTINLIVAELIVVAGLVVTMIVTWPAIPWDRMTWIILACMVPAPIFTYPYSKSLWLAIDLIFQPPQPSEFRASSTQ